MKIKLWVAALICLCILCSAFIFGNSNRNTNKTQVLHDLSGNSMPASTFQGKWVILNYWAPWCGYCIHEIPELNHFYEHHHDRNVLFYGVDYDHPSMDDLKKIVTDMNIRFPILIEDPNTVWPLDVQDSVPVTFIINPKGRVAKIIYGPSTEQSLLDTLHELQK